MQLEAFTRMHPSAIIAISTLIIWFKRYKSQLEEKIRVLERINDLEQEHDEIHKDVTKLTRKKRNQAQQQHNARGNMQAVHFTWAD